MGKKRKGRRQARPEGWAARPQQVEAWLDRAEGHMMHQAYNRALSHRLLLRTGEALRDVERAIELEDRPKNREIYEQERAFLRHIVEEQLATRGPDYTVDQLMEEQRTFWRGVRLMAAGAWEEAESAFRRVIAIGDVPHQPWGNLGACLIMQERYDEAEEALRKALEIYPDYAPARRNLMMLPAIRKTGPPASMRIEEPWQERKLEQSVQFFEQEES